MTKMIKKTLRKISKNTFVGITVPTGSVLIDVQIIPLGFNFDCNFFYLSGEAFDTELEKYYIIMDAQCKEIHCEPSDLKLVSHVEGCYLFEVMFPCVVENLKQMGDIRE